MGGHYDCHYTCPEHLFQHVRRQSSTGNRMVEAWTIHWMVFPKLVGNCLASPTRSDPDQHTVKILESKRGLAATDSWEQVVNKNFTKFENSKIYKL